MIIFLPIKQQLTGGTSSFARKFKQGMEARGHEVTYNFRPDYDVLLVAASCPLSYLVHAKWHKKKIVHRLDGVHYPTTIAGWFYPLYNFPLWLARQFVDITIYQSKYAKYCCEKFLGRARSKKGHIIYNGVDTGLFSRTTDPFPARTAGLPLRKGEQDITFLTAQKFRRRDQIEPLIQAVKIFRRRYNKDAKLIVIGDFYGEALVTKQKYIKNTWVEFLGPVDHDKLAALHKQADIFLYCHPNSSCPNNVLEAMASGLPIAGVADGAMPEIVQANGELIPAPRDGFFKPRQLDLSLFADNLHKIFQNKERYSAASRWVALEKFSLEKMIGNYLTALDQQSGI